MKTILLFTTLIFFAFGTTKAQTGPYYSFTQFTSTYTNLANPVSVNHDEVWQFVGGNNSVFGTIDFGLALGQFVAWGINYNQMDINDNGVSFKNTTAQEHFYINGLSVGYPDGIVDKGYGTGTSLSPISYEVDGTGTNTIVKVEWKNASHASSTADYTNVQLWLYRADNSFEIHYGTSSFADAANTTFYIGAAYGNYNINTDAEDDFLDNGPSNPVITDVPSYNFKGIPANGTVYRFAHGAAGVHTVNNLSGVKIYPSLVADKLNLAHVQAEKTTAKIYNVEGQLLLSDNVTGGNSAIDVSPLTSGIYFIELSSASDKRTEKFVKL